MKTWGIVIVIVIVIVIDIWKPEVIVIVIVIVIDTWKPEVIVILILIVKYLVIIYIDIVIDSMSDQSIHLWFISTASAYITSSSGDVTTDIGSNITLEITASGDPDDITYVWKKDGVIIPGETSNTLVLTDVSPFDIGQYECIPSNSVGSHNSSIIQVDVKCELIFKLSHEEL